MHTYPIFWGILPTGSNRAALELHHFIHEANNAPNHDVFTVVMCAYLCKHST